jgi:hypothetical protein
MQKIVEGQGLPSRPPRNSFEMKDNGIFIGVPAVPEGAPTAASSGRVSEKEKQ